MKIETWRWKTKVEGENTLYKRERGKRTKEKEITFEMGDEAMYVLSCRAKLKYFKIQMHQFYDEISAFCTAIF